MYPRQGQKRNPYELDQGLQQDDIFGNVGAGDQIIAYATVEVQPPSGLVWAYASVNDNATADPAHNPDPGAVVAKEDSMRTKRALLEWSCGLLAVVLVCTMTAPRIGAAQEIVLRPVPAPAAPAPQGATEGPGEPGAAGPTCGKWQWANPRPQGETLWGVAYGNGVFVAVGSFGSILTSTDGADWTARDSGTLQALSGVEWCGTQFVAVGGQGIVLTSADGFTWTAQQTGTTEALYGVASNGSTLVVVGWRGTVITSRDGVVWTNRDAGTDEPQRGVCWTGAEFISVGRNATVLKSPDGTSWTAYQLVIGGLVYPEDLNAIATNGSRLVVAGSNGLLSSADGATWEQHGGGRANGIAWGGGLFVAPSLYGRIATSPDGTAWTWQPTDQDISDLWAAVWGAGRFVVSGSYGLMYSSLSGATWENHYFDATAREHKVMDLEAVTSMPGKHVAVGWWGIVLTSPDGAMWAAWDSGTERFLSDVAWGGSKLVAVGERGTILTSADGEVWIPRTSGTTTWLTGVAWGAGRWVAIGSGGTIRTSTDAVTWVAPQSSPTTGSLSDLVWTGTQFVAVGAAIFTSPDGLVWTIRGTDVGELVAVTFGGGRLVGVGRQSSAMSLDGITWEAHPVGLNLYLFLSDVTWTGTQFVAVGQDGKVVLSPDGVSWIVEQAPTRAWLKAVSWDGLRLLAVGSTGKILRSECAQPKTPRVRRRLLRRQA